MQNTQTQTQNLNTQKIENPNPNLNLWVLLGAHVCRQFTFQTGEKTPPTTHLEHNQKQQPRSQNLIVNNGELIAKRLTKLPEATRAQPLLAPHVPRREREVHVPVINKE